MIPLSSHQPWSVRGVVLLEGSVEGGHDGVTVSLVGSDKAPSLMRMAPLADGRACWRTCFAPDQRWVRNREIAGVVMDAGLPTVLQEPIRLRRSRGQIKGGLLCRTLNSDGVPFNPGDGASC